MNLGIILAAIIINTNNGQTNNHLYSNIDHPSIIEPGVSLVERTANETAARVQSEREKSRQTSARESNKRYDGTIPYAYGFCTYYVAKEKGISASYGNARDWPVNSEIPKTGSVIVTYESRWGHVGIVTSVEGDEITIKEMNYAGWNKVSTRTVNYKTLALKGFLI